MTKWGLIPVRMGSKRLPGKPLLDLHGLPMVAHVAMRSMMSKSLDRVVVCTDSPEIAEECMNRKIEVCITPTNCDNGTERILKAAISLSISPTDVIVDIQGDEPLVSPTTIDLIVQKMIMHSNSQDILLPHSLNCEVGNRNIVKLVESNGRVIYLSRSDVPYMFNNNEPLKRHLSIIGFTMKSLARYGELPVGQLERLEGVELLRAVEAGMVVGTFEINDASFSVDVPSDLAKAERALGNCELFKRGYSIARRS